MLALTGPARRWEPNACGSVCSLPPGGSSAAAAASEAVELYLEEVDDPAGHVTATPLVTSFQLPAA
jgi:hypothetical protein